MNILFIFILWYTYHYISLCILMCMFMFLSPSPCLHISVPESHLSVCLCVLNLPLLCCEPHTAPWCVLPEPTVTNGWSQICSCFQVLLSFLRHLRLLSTSLTTTLFHSPESRTSSAPSKEGKTNNQKIPYMFWKGFFSSSVTLSPEQPTTMTRESCQDFCPHRTFAGHYADVCWVFSHSLIKYHFPPGWVEQL